ncbi:MAG: phosphodiester glycosidase family protein [Candidatus Sericytochromatia bacterium]|nr:phosphodiester glycosidase family protein [Candidatus Tanganyikabacteria bacterium]
MNKIAWILAAALVVVPLDPFAQAAFAKHDRPKPPHHRIHKSIKAKKSQPPRPRQDARDLKPRFGAVARGVGFWEGTLYTAAGPVRMHVLKVDLRRADVAPVLAKAQPGAFGLERTSSMSGRVGALAGINGSFFSPRNRQPLDLLAVNGKWLAQKSQRPAFVVKEDGTASILPSRKARERSVLSAIGGGPTLLSNGKISLAGWPRNMGGRAPRTAAGLTWDGKVVLLTIDGRRTGSVGATIREEARYMAALGCREAINLDGGGSATMVVRGRVVNNPSDGQERAVSNALLVFPKHTYVTRPMPRRSPYSGFSWDRS